MRKIFGAHSAPVAASSPALGMISSVPVSFAIFTMPICTPLVHGADQHVDLVALHQLVGVLRRLGRLGFVVDREVLDLAAAELAAALR